MYAIGVSACTALFIIIAIIIGLKFWPAAPTLAQMEESTKQELQESSKHKEEARKQMCDMYATVYASCLINKDTSCTKRDQILKEYITNFSGNAEYDCDPKNTASPPVTDTTNPLFFGDESSQ